MNADIQCIARYSDQKTVGDVLQCIARCADAAMTEHASDIGQAPRVFAARLWGALEIMADIDPLNPDMTNARDAMTKLFTAAWGPIGANEDSE